MVQTLRYGRRPMVETSHSTAILQRGRFMWGLILQFTMGSLEFKGVFTSIVPDLCENFLSGSTVRKMVRKVGFLRLFGLAM